MFLEKSLNFAILFTRWFLGGKPHMIFFGYFIFLKSIFLKFNLMFYSKNTRNINS